MQEKQFIHNATLPRQCEGIAKETNANMYDIE